MKFNGSALQIHNCFNLLELRCIDLVTNINLIFDFPTTNVHSYFLFPPTHPQKLVTCSGNTGNILVATHTVLDDDHSFTSLLLAVQFFLQEFS